jgi:hypothetical protein
MEILCGADSPAQRTIETMKAFEVEAERSELALVLFQSLAVLFEDQRVTAVFHRDAFRNQPGNLPIQSLALLSETLPLMFLVDVHAPLREYIIWMSLPVILDSSKLRILPVDDDDRIQHLRALISEVEHLRIAAQRLVEELNERLQHSAFIDAGRRRDERRSGPSATPRFQVRQAMTRESVEWTTEHERRTSTCPHCKTARGNPISVAVGAGQQVLTFRCPSCANQWTTIRPEKASERHFIPARR